MGAATDDVDYTLEEQEGDVLQDLPLKGAIRVFAGTVLTDDGTGFLHAWVSTDTLGGFCLRQAPTQNITTIPSADGSTQARVLTRGHIYAPVTGVAGVADRDKTVYMSDDHTFSLSVVGPSVGKIERVDTPSLKCSILFETPAARSI